MSDLEQNRESFDRAEDVTDLRHSGNLNLEYPVFEFDRTPLAVANEQGLLVTPETPEDLGAIDEEKQLESKGKRKGLWIISAIGVLALTGAFMLGRNTDNESDTSIDDTPTAETSGGLIDPKQPNESIVIETTPPTVNTASPNIDNDAIVSDGEGLDPASEATISIERPNGEILEIPKLQSPENQKLFIESLLSLWAAYLATGNTNALNELSSTPDVQNLFIRQRQSLMIDYTEPIMDVPYAGNYQYVFQVDSSDPPIWNYNKSTGDFVLASGTLMMKFSNDAKWQGLNSTEDWPAKYIFEKLSLHVYVDKVATHVDFVDLTLKTI